MTSTEVQRKGCSSFITCQHFLLKLLYLLQDTGHECGYEIYQVIFLKHIGLSSKQAGLILSVQQLAAVAVSPFLGMISDKTKRTKELLIVLLVSGSFILFAQFFVRPLSSKNDVKLFGDLDLSCYNCTEKTISESLFASLELQNISSFEFVQVNCFNSTLDVALITNQNLTQHVATKPSPCNRVKENMLRKCIANWVNVSEENLRLKSSSTAHLLLATSGNIRCVGRRNFANVTIGDDQRETTDDSTFWIMLILVLLSVFTVRGCEPIIDATVISALGEENEWKFGRIILPGTISAGIMSAVVGKLKDLTEEYIGAYAATTTNISYIPMYASTALAWFCAAYVTYKSDITSEISTPVKLADIKTVFKNVHFIIFVLLLILYGFAQGVLGGYVFWFAEVKLNAPTVVLGLSTLAGCISDIPALFFSGHVIRRIGSPAIFIISMILFAGKIFF
ncbi:uncharacterized protein LOC143450257 isoform X2 [Clavelina lepadiformis]|uniref:uncharacterized protein LOC143450257 isoform X2 n=1 Tax=Clavelina lepadiformis TaxID=159417 RepID=UPI0040415AB3